MPPLSFTFIVIVIAIMLIYKELFKNTKTEIFEEFASLNF